MYEYGVIIESIIDGDTLKLDVDLGFKLHLKQTFRLARINAPELLSINGVKAKAFVVAELTDLIAVKVRSSRSEKYGRWLGELLYQKRGQAGVWHNLSDKLLETRNAMPYRY